MNVTEAGEAKRNWLFFLSKSYWMGTPKLVAPAASLDDPILTNHSNNHVGLDSNWLRDNGTSSLARLYLFV